MTADVGVEIVTDGAACTVTDAFVAGVAVGCGVAVVPESVSVTVNTQFVVVPVGVYVSAETPELEKPGQLPEEIAQAYVNVPVPPDGVAVIVTDCPWSMTTDVGEIDTVGGELTVTVSQPEGWLSGPAFEESVTT